MSKEAAQAAVTAFYEAEEALQDIIDEVKSECGEELWEQMLKSLHERKSACDMARKMVKEAGVSIDDFKIQMRSKNVWDSEKAVAIAKHRGELDDMIERGIIVQAFDPRVAKQMLEDTVFSIYEDDCHSTIKNASVAVLGPKPDDTVLD